MAPVDVVATHLSPSYHFRQRRLSLESAFSEISELTMLPCEPPDPALMRTISNTSNISKASIHYKYPAAGKGLLRQRLWNLYDENYGALLVLLSQLFGSLMNIFTRLLEHEGPHGAPMHPLQILFVRQSLTALLCTTYAMTTKSIPYFPLGPPDRKVRMLLMCRGFAGFFGVFGLYFSLLYLPLSEATVLTFLAPILTCYLCSYLIPGETFSKHQQMAGFLSLFGVVFIAQPFSFLNSNVSSTVTSAGDAQGLDSNINLANTTSAGSEPNSGTLEAQPTASEHLFAIAIAMVGVVGATVAITSIRAIGTRAHAFISVNYFSTWCSILCLIALVIIPSVNFRFPANLTEWVLLISLGTCGFVMQGLLTMGLAYKATGKGGESGQPRMKRNISQAEGGSRTRDDNCPSNEFAESEDIEMQRPQTGADTRNGTSLPSLVLVEARTRNLSVEGNGRLQRHRHNKNRVPPSSSGTRATSMLYTQMLFALAGDRIVFGVTPSLWSWVGIALVITGAIWVASARDKPTSGGLKEATTTTPDRVSTYLDQNSSRYVTKEGEESLGLLAHGEVGDAFDSGDEFIHGRTSSSSSSSAPRPFSPSTTHHNTSVI